RSPRWPPFSFRLSQCLAEVRGILDLLHRRGDVLEQRQIDEGDPDRRALLGLEIEMLVLDAAGFHRQQNEIALLPVPTLAVDHGIALALEHVDDEPALMAMLTGHGGDLMGEHAPLL